MDSRCNAQALQPPASPSFAGSALSPMLARLLRAWTTRRQARAGSGIDAYFARERNDHERFLSKATDVYELERLERAWEHRHIDMRRVY